MSSDINKRLDVLEEAGGVLVLAVWRYDAPLRVRIVQPESMAGTVTLAEFEQIAEPKTLIRVVRQGEHANSPDE